jgi:acetaldehyde dehydrogenase
MSVAQVAIIGSGNIGTDLMIKVLRVSRHLEVAAMVGIDPESDGLARAARLGVPTTSKGVQGLIAMPQFKDVEIILDATSAKAHLANVELLKDFNKTLIDLTPAAIGPFVVPTVNLDEQLGASNVNMVTCGGQATIPIVAAVSSVAKVLWAEIVASIASRSAGPGTRANIDEFTQTTAAGIEQLGGAIRGKAIIVLNPAEPPMIMRDTVQCIVGDADPAEICASVESMVASVASYVPGYRLKQLVQVIPLLPKVSYQTLIGTDAEEARWQVTVFLEVEGAAHYLPAYAGNLDIMTSAALRVAEAMANRDSTFASGAA